MSSLRSWIKATQPHSFVASLVGVALGTAIAWHESRNFDAIGLLLTAIGVVCLHAATNMSNDSIDFRRGRSEEHTSELQSRSDLVCRLLLEKKKKVITRTLHEE